MSNALLPDKMQYARDVICLPETSRQEDVKEDTQNELLAIHLCKQEEIDFYLSVRSTIWAHQ